MKITWQILLMFISQLAFSQKILLDKNVNEAYKIIEGPNTKTFRQAFISSGFILAEDNNSNAQIHNFKSGFFELGYRQKFKILSFYSIGYEISYKASRYHLKQNEDKLLPNADLHDKEKLRFHGADFCLFNRINVDKRGNIIGKFIDIGGYVDLVIHTTHYTKDKILEDEDNTLSEVRIVKNSGLKYPNRFNYGIKTRVGINWFAIKAAYRVSDLFKEEYDLPELPRISIGIELTFPN
jgi:hypothetical protein